MVNKIALETGPKIVIIGAGCGGLAFAIGLARKYGYENYTIYEQASDVGGTWRGNKYPGCSSDTGMPLYSLSTDLKPDWEYSHGYQPQIQDYWRDLSIKYHIHPRIVFNTRVISAKWSQVEQLYDISIQNVITGEKEETKVEIVISALGILDVPNYPAIPGIETFGGVKFHSGEWDHSYNLSGKRVAVIGNGASATQFLPIISEDPTVDVTNFCRTPNWFIPPVRTKIGKFKIFCLKYIPLLTRLSRFSSFLLTELFYWFVFGTRFMHPFLRKAGAMYITRTAPAEYQDKLVPNYTLGCKRLIFDTNYLESLHRPNMRINWDGIESIDKDGIITKNREKIPFDVLILATGYVADDYPLDLRGKNQTVKEYYDNAGGPKAYLGTTIPGFPNLFLIAGPNTATGNTSVVLFEEIQVAYLMQLLKPLLDGTISSVEVTVGPTDAYNDKIHARLSKSVFMDCVSWYRRGGKGKVNSIFPGPGSLFWWWLRRVDLSHYVGVPEERWSQYRQKEKLRRILRRLGLGCIFFLAVFLVLGGACFPILYIGTGRCVGLCNRFSMCNEST